MRINSYADAVRLANAAGMDAANRRMRKAGRTAWSIADRNHCCDVVENILTSLGYDVRGWAAMAGVPRNEPPEPKPAKKSKRRAVALGLAPEQQATAAAPVQLNFAFA